MNCKQGDMARVVPDHPNDEWARGRIVRCVARDLEPGPPAWIIEPQLRSPSGIAWSVQDSILRPIRGGDVSEAEVRELFAPKQPEVA